MNVSPAQELDGGAGPAFSLPKESGAAPPSSNTEPVLEIGLYLREVLALIAACDHIPEHERPRSLRSALASLELQWRLAEHRGLARS